MHEPKLPWDMIEEILSRVPPKSLVRFRAVCKPWNNLLDDKTFINNHKTSFQFVLRTKSKIYSVSVSNLEIVVRDITLDIPIPRNLVNWSEVLLCGDAIWNLWLRQSRWIVPVSMRFEGIGYDDNRACYKLLASLNLTEVPLKTLWRIYDFASDTWKDKGNSDSDSTQKPIHLTIFSVSVSLDGTLYFLASPNKTNEEEEERLLIQIFDFSKERFFIFCGLPCERNHDRDALVLGVFKGDRFLLLKQCFATKKIEIWVTKNKWHACMFMK